MDNAQIIWVPLFPGAEYRAIFMTECFELTYHGGGGFSWSEVWDMPIQHRKYNIKKINEYLKKLEDMRDKQNNQITENTDPSKIKIPDAVLQASKEYSYKTTAAKSKK